MTLNASDALVGVVYYTPKGRAMERVSPAADTPPDGVRFRRPAFKDEVNVAGSFQLLTEPPEPVAPVVVAEVAAPPPPRLLSILGQSIDTTIQLMTDADPPLTDDELEELYCQDTRARVQRAIESIQASRKMALPASEAAPPIVVVAQGPIDVEEIPLTSEPEPAPPGKGEWRDGVLVPEVALVVDEARLWWWHDEAESYARLTRSEVAASPDSGLLSEVGDDDAKAAHEVARDAAWAAEMDRVSREVVVEQEANEVAEATPAEIGAASEPGSGPSGGGDTVATAPTDGLPWPAVPVEVLGSEPAPAADPSTSSAPADAQPVAVEVSGATTAKERPRGWCPACRQKLTVRADGTMMQHFTPDGAKGPDGKRIDCQGVGLTPAAERPPEPRLPLPVAMGVAPPVAPVIDRPALVSPSADPVIADAGAAASEVLAAAEAVGDAATVALESILEIDGDAPPVAVKVPAPISRYTVGGSVPYGWIIFDIARDGAMVREDGTLARWEHEADAREALVYVREHGELPGDVAPEVVDEPGPIPAAQPSRVWRMLVDPVRGSHDDMVDAVDQALRFPGGAPAPAPARPGNPLEALTRIVEEAKSRGVRVRIVIEPIE